MEPIIGVYLNPFDIQQQIYYKNNDEFKILAYCTIDDLSTLIPQYCELENVYNIIIQGSKEYGEKIANDIKISNYDYSKNINIEVI